ncbi:MAG: hypothetical protein HOW97_03035 [Catenulispora sp.]|nr:hypothetical protein [Catenulispora sp.]
MPKTSKTTTAKTAKKTTAKTVHTSPATASADTAAPPLTDRQQMLLARLSATAGISAAELAAAAEIGRSTAQHDLVALENAGLARREGGIREGARRSPDQWFHATAATASESGDAANAASQAADTPDVDGATPGEPNSAPTGETPDPAPSGGEQDTAVPAADPDDADDADGPAAGSAARQEEPPAAPGQDTDAPTPAAVEPRTAPAAEAPTAPPTDAPTEPAAGRLGKGALLAMVEAYLRAHPEQDFTATQIGKALNRSSGAVANCLDKLVGDHIAEQTSAAPRKFRLSAEAAAQRADV